MDMWTNLSDPRIQFHYTVKDKCVFVYGQYEVVCHECYQISICRAYIEDFTLLNDIAGYVQV